MHTAQEILQQSNPIEYHSDFLEFFCDDVFSSAFLIQITWNKHKAQFFRNTWLKNEPLHTICKESGKIELAKILPIIRQIQALCLPPVFESTCQGRDGQSYKLTIGNGSTFLSYDWYEVFVPDKWVELNVIGKALEKIHVNWVGDEKNYFRLSYNEEETEIGFSSLLNWRKI